MPVKLTLFDLDHTLLAGDSDMLWCDFLVARGRLDAGFAARNRRMQADYRTGRVDTQAFCDFYVGTLAGHAAAELQALRREFLEQCVAPRIPAAAHALVARHRDAGELLVLTTATNRFITELTAVHLGIAQLIATECELDAARRFTGRTLGVPNMREGKVARLHAWLAARRIALSECDSTFYSDSINDLPLLEAVRRRCVVDPDPQLAGVAAERGWTSVSLHA